MSTCALTLAVCLLTAACAGAAFGGALSGCGACEPVTVALGDAAASAEHLLTSIGDSLGFVVASERGNATRASVGGRSWVVDGEITTARLTREIPATVGPQQRRLVASWAQDQLRARVSEAALARAIHELLSIGVAPEPIRAAQAAIADQLEHARPSVALASRHAGVPLHPAALPMSPNFGTVSDSRAGDPAALAIAVFEQGCINESVAAAEAAVAALICSDSQAEAALDRIARIAGHGQAVAPALLAKLRASPLGHPGHPGHPDRSGGVPRPKVQPPAASSLAHHGRLSSRLSCHQGAAIQRRVVAELIAPLARDMSTLSMLSTSTAEPALA